LPIAHDIPAASHLGVPKSKDPLLHHFYWPSINQDVKEFCHSCDVCQHLGKEASNAPVPLHSLPLGLKPFCQISADTIGPLPVCKNTGNRFILTVPDLCTHYPEAIPLKQHTSEDVAQALANVFSHFGFPQVILFYQGSDFMSALMQIFLNEFWINQIRTSMYHPQMNRTCERFNGTLKSMPQFVGHCFAMGSFCLPRSVVETLGCSPFDLLIGRSVAGPLSLLKTAWLQQNDLRGTKQNVMSLSFAPVNGSTKLLTLPTSRRCRNIPEQNIGTIVGHANERFSQATKSLSCYQYRVTHCKPSSKFHGPYVIEQQLGLVDYVISTPDRCKTKRVCHTNLLKQYHKRDQHFLTCDTMEHIIVAHETVPERS